MSSIALMITFTACQGQTQALAEHLAQAGASYANESGTHAFIVHTSPAQPRQVIVYERYIDEAAKQRHEQGPTYGAIRNKTGEYLDGPPMVLPLNLLGGKLFA